MRSTGRSVRQLHINSSFIEVIVPNSKLRGSRCGAPGRSANTVYGQLAFDVELGEVPGNYSSMTISSA